MLHDWVFIILFLHFPMHLRSDEYTLAEMFKSKGYSTAHFGKWHLASEVENHPIPKDQGFDYSFYTFNNALPSHHDPINFFRDDKPIGPLTGYACQLIINDAVRWLSTRKQKRRPFYLNIWFNEPHDKVAAPNSLTSRHSYNEKYYGAIENMDDAVGRLMKYLKDNDLDKNTIVMFSSDNETKVVSSNLPLRGEKLFNYEGGVRVPFIIKWPGKIKAGSTSPSSGSFTDILPTMAALTKADLPLDRKIDGINLEKAILGNASKLKRETPILFYRYSDDPITTLRKDNYVLLGYDAVSLYSRL